MNWSDSVRPSAGLSEGGQLDTVATLPLQFVCKGVLSITSVFVNYANSSTPTTNGRVRR